MCPILNVRSPLWEGREEFLSEWLATRNLSLDHGAKSWLVALPDISTRAIQSAPAYASIKNFSETRQASITSTFVEGLTFDSGEALHAKPAGLRLNKGNLCSYTPVLALFFSCRSSVRLQLCPGRTVQHRHPTPV